MNEVIHELKSLAESRFPQEKADLVILGTPDSSGVPVEERQRDIRFEHAHVQYRLVPVETLTKVIDSYDASRAEARKWMDLCVEFQRTAPREFWPEELRRAADLLDQSRGGEPPRRFNA